LRRPWLAPFVPLYAAAIQLRSAALQLGLEPVQRLAWPVVSVGSLSAGGAGKTPFVIALASLLHAHGFSVDILSRGYGRQSSGAALVDPAGTPSQFGDEPLLIAQATHLPVYVAARRFEAGRLAELSQSPTGPPTPPRFHLLDDGFQHRQLARSVDIALVTSDDLHDHLLPAGNLRESPSALRRAHILAVPSGDDQAIDVLTRLGLAASASSTRPIWRYRRQMVVPEQITAPAAPKVLAFCGIARPEQFFAGLRAAGVRLAAQRDFPDHHPFTRSDLQSLEALARDSGAVALVTTAKDRVRLAQFESALKIPLDTAGLQIVFEDGSSILNHLRHHLQQPVSSVRRNP
jgi:tetraacyldisaccharide 4'-kinase